MFRLLSRFLSISFILLCWGGIAFLVYLRLQPRQMPPIPKQNTENYLILNAAEVNRYLPDTFQDMVDTVSVAFLPDESADITVTTNVDVDTILEKLPGLQEYEAILSVMLQQDTELCANVSLSCNKNQLLMQLNGMKLNGFSLPSELLDVLAAWLSEKMNLYLSEQKDIRLDACEIVNNRLYLKGEWPDEP